MINIPLIDGKSALRVVGYSTEFGGFIDAHREGGAIDENVNSGSRSGVRAALKMDLNETLTFTPRIIYQKIDTDGFNRQEVFNLYANPFTTTRTPITFGEREQFLLKREAFSDDTIIADGTIEANFNGFDFTSVSSYTDRDILVSRDASALTGSVSVDLGFPDNAVMLPSNLRDTTTVEQFTQEFRLSSNHDGPVQWVVGYFYANTDRFYTQFLPTPGYDAFVDDVLGEGTVEATAMGVAPKDSPFYSQLPYSLKQSALFGEFTYDVSDEFHVTAGGRGYDYSEERSVTQVGVFGAGVVDQIDRTSAKGFTPRFLASYDISDTVTWNAQISKGFRLGGVNDPLNTALCNAGDLSVFGGFQDYDDETLWNYEAGIKVRTNTVQFNAALFYTKISNLQATLDAGSCSSRISFNVPKAHSQGIEFEVKAQTASGFDFNVAGSMIQSKFDSSVLDSNGNILAGLRDGNRLPSVPKVNLGFTSTYNFNVDAIGDGSEGYVSATFQYRSSIFTQPSDQEAGAGIFASGLAFGGATGLDTTVLDLELDPYKTLNLSAGIIMEKMEVVLFINNVFDENANLSFDRERGGRARLGFRTNQPRTIGLTVRTAF